MSVNQLAAEGGGGWRGGGGTRRNAHAVEVRQREG